VAVPTSTHCHACSCRARTAPVGFEQSIGALVVRWHSQVEGDLCFWCLNRYFWTHTLVTLLFGWWGVWSFITNLGAIPANVISYAWALVQMVRPGGPRRYVEVGGAPGLGTQARIW
jgi:hypothetical protein